MTCRLHTAAVRLERKFVIHKRLGEIRVIPLHEADKPHKYAYVAGCRNVAWLVGKIHEIDHEKKIIKITRSADESKLIPIHLERGDRIPDDFKVADNVKLICHVYSGIKGDDDDDVKAGRYARLVAKLIDRPTLLDMRTTGDFSQLDLSGNDGAFDSFELPETFTPVSNTIELAGFVDGAPMLVRDQDHERDRLIFMLRQADSPQLLIPVEIAGKHAPSYRKVVTVGMAVFVTGIVMSAKRPDNGESVAAIRSNHVRKAVPSKDFQFETLPDWVKSIRIRWANHVQQERARAAAMEAARQAQATALSLSA
ncbi:hypothetical protein HW932_21145 [Allochromatium humboldtianum]|uniref:Uncharacterized protein n=1 Tax=Allochromatium humboldtianum TaxID=504901 RepID=A0A850RJS5_9GAMM|nr:hypothetical protein [Allochromatium humboldtianum]NVZ11757.1 hypothetical protein [Allochromatium humboldtianum]